MAAAAAAPHDIPMLEYLQNTLRIGNATLCQKLVDGGIRTGAILVPKGKDWVHNCCSNIRKGGGAEATKNIMAELEEQLEQLALWCRYMYLVQRPIHLRLATLEHI